MRKSKVFETSSKVVITISITDTNGVENAAEATAIFQESFFAEDFPAILFQDSVMKFIKSCTPGLVEDLMELADMTAEERKERLTGAKNMKVLEEIEQAKELWKAEASEH